MNAQQVSMAVNGLQGLGDSKEARALVAALGAKAKQGCRKKNDEIDEKFDHFLHFSAKSLAAFLQSFEIGAVQKYIYLVDLGKCCKMSIWLRNLASIWKRTSFDKFCIFRLENWS